MVSWIEVLERRQAAAQERIDGLRQQIGELTTQLAAEEALLSRLEITRETMTQLLAEPVEAGQPGLPVGTADPAAAGGTPIGVVKVPPWSPGLDAGVLPVAYRDVLEVLADAGRPLRAGQLATALGLGEGAARVEGLRSKLKRLAGRGWLSEPDPGLFSLVDPSVVGAPPAGQVPQAGSSS